MVNYTHFIHKRLLYELYCFKFIFAVQMRLNVGSHFADKFTVANPVLLHWHNCKTWKMVIAVLQMADTMVVNFYSTLNWKSIIMFCP
jgi:hypothetical protein